MPYEPPSPQDPIDISIMDKRAVQLRVALLAGLALLFVLASVLSSSAAGAAADPATAAASPPAIDSPADGAIDTALEARLDHMVQADGARGVTLIVYDKAGKRHRIDRGDIAPDAQLPVASASKWLTAALAMTLVDDGHLALDQPIGERLPYFTGAAAAITLRQLLSFTAGQGSMEAMTDARQDPRITLTEAARAIAALPLQDPPGTVFKYGGPSMQVVGALVEQATGVAWSQVFDERIARPLGMHHTYWAQPLWPNVPVQDVHNPNLQGGLVTTAEEYARFLSMLANDGVFQGHRILSHDAIQAMEQVQTHGLPMAYIPGGHTDLQYALGNWCEQAEVDGRCDIVSSPGALGAYPWIDRRNGLYAVFFMRRRLGFVAPDIQQARRIIETAGAW
jgi:CubicO group peptidase (beta-lactamase class C family)